MLLRHHHMMRSGFEPETIATVARMSSAPSGADFIAYDNLIKAIKQGQALPLRINNLSTKFSTLYIRAAHDSQAALLNWVSSSYDASISGTPTFTQYVGFRSASSSYLNWNFNPSTHSTFPYTNYISGGYVTSNPARGNKSILGLIDIAGGEGTMRILPRQNTDLSNFVVTQSLGAGGGTIAATDMRGFYYCGRPNGNDKFMGRELVTEQPTIGSRNFHNGNMYELASNDLGTGNATFFLDGDVSFTFWGGLSGINVPNLRTAVRDYLLMRGISGI